MKVVIFANNKLTKRALRDFALDDLSKSIDIEYWDCNSLLIPSIPVTPKEQIIERPFTVKISSVQELRTNLSRLSDDTIGIIMLFTTPEMYGVHSLIAAKICCAIFFTLNLAVWESLQGKFLQSSENARADEGVSRNNWSISFKALKHKLYKNETFYLISKYIRYRGGGQYTDAKREFKERRIYELYKRRYTMGCSPYADFQTCHPDYDKILELEANSHPKIDDKYIVFVDQYYPLHPDYKEWYPNFDWDALAPSYYRSMNRFFEAVEKEYNCNVVIAAHPSADYTCNPFNGRKIYQYKTVELVKDSLGVILHSSNSLNFVIYYDKPICFVSNKSMKVAEHLERSLYQMSYHLSADVEMPLYDIDSLLTVKDIFHRTDPKLREQYILRYFGDISKGLSHAEILKKHFINIYQQINK